MHMKNTWRLALVVVLGLLAVLIVAMSLLADAKELQLEPPGDSSHRRLVVMVHGLSGREAFEPAVALARESLPRSDFLIFAYDTSLLSNASPYVLANKMEREIHALDTRRGYDEIVLVGHSMGGMLLRKVVLWANGIEDDRAGGRAGVRTWAGKVSRFVSLASINRGWSVDPRPAQMGLGRYLAIRIGERLSRWSGSGKLHLALQRGAPFVADSRVQWIDLCRGNGPQGAKAPLTIHLLGDKDDVVSRDDGADIGVAKDTLFATLADTDHGDIATALRGESGSAAESRRQAIRAAMQGRKEQLDIDRTPPMAEDLTVTRLVYVMHGIRDYGDWSDTLGRAIREESAKGGQGGVVVASAKYGHFPMLPFLLYWDRQKNVRWFMDDFTQNKARYPKLQAIDYVGHSNGSYILASALQRYPSLRVNRVYFAGSVVPKHYPWRDLLDRQRVGTVANVVADGDWVVAIFPRFFEQVADWSGSRSVDGLLDIGSAGFRGFQASQDPSRKVVNYQFVKGGHGAGVDVSDAAKAQAIATYVVRGDATAMAVFENERGPQTWLDWTSNLCWLVWALLAALLGAGMYFAFRQGRLAGAASVLLVLGLLTSV